MPTRTERSIAAVLFSIYLIINVVLFLVIPSIGGLAYWGESARDALAVGAVMAIGIPLFATTFGFRPM